MLDGYPDIFDVLLGTLDRADFEKVGIEPERHVWWGCGVEWVKGLVRKGSGAPRHGTGDVSVSVE